MFEVEKEGDMSLFIVKGYWVIVFSWIGVAVSCYLDYSFHYSALNSLQAIHIFLESEENMSIKCHELLEAQLKVLEDVRELSIPHDVQCKKLYPLKKLPPCQSSYHYMNDYYIYFAEGQNSSAFPYIYR